MPAEMEMSQVTSARSSSGGS